MREVYLGLFWNIKSSNKPCHVDLKFKLSMTRLTKQHIDRFITAFIDLLL